MQLYPKIYASKLLNVKTPAIFNDTKVSPTSVWKWSLPCERALSSKPCPGLLLELDKGEGHYAIRPLAINGVMRGRAACTRTTCA